MITTRRESVFDAPADIITNTVNTRGVMGAGLAYEFKLRYPGMFEDYELRCDRGSVEPGQPYLFHREEPPHILNFPTKDHWRRPSKIEWVESGLEWIAQREDDLPGGSIAIPRLGASHGGLPWEDVRRLIDEVLTKTKLDVLVCLDEAPQEGGAEHQMLEQVNQMDPGRVTTRFDVRRDIARRIIEARPFIRFREILSVDGVGKGTYESLFQELYHEVSSDSGHGGHSPDADRFGQTRLDEKGW